MLGKGASVRLRLAQGEAYWDDGGMENLMVEAGASEAAGKHQISTEVLKGPALGELGLIHAKDLDLTPVWP